MKIILTKDVQGLGKVGDVKDVSDGYARNFLLAKHLGLPATNVALDKIQKEQAEKQAKMTKENERALNLKAKLEGKTIAITGKAQKQSLFAAIHEKDIALAITEKLGTEVAADSIIIKNPIKTLGNHTVEVKLAQNLSATVKLEVKGNT
jgi:large subunit ribosomal protein L9